MAAGSPVSGQELVKDGGADAVLGGRQRARLPETGLILGRAAGGSRLEQYDAVRRIGTPGWGPVARDVGRVLEGGAGRGEPAHGLSGRAGVRAGTIGGLVPWIYQDRAHQGVPTAGARRGLRRPDALPLVG